MKKHMKALFVVIDYPDLQLENDRIQNAISSLIESVDVDGIVYTKIVDKTRQMDEVVQFALLNEVDSIIIYVPTFVWAGRFIQGLRRSTVPIILWSECVPHSFPLEGTALLHGSLGQVGIKCEILYGNATDKNTIKRARDLIYAAYAMRKLSFSRFGLLGGVSMEINTGIINPLKWMERFGIDTVFVEQQEIIYEGEKFNEKIIKEFYLELQNRFGSVVPYDIRFDHAIRLYFGYKKIIEKYDLDFASLKCIFDLSNHYASACLAQGLLNEGNFVSACCGESNAAITMYMLRLMCVEPMMMADIAHIDVNEKRLHLLCDGSASPAIATNDKSIQLNYQNEVESAAGGICVTLIGKPGEVTIAKFAEYHGEFILHIAHGEAFIPDSTIKNECGFDTWPHIHVRLNSDPLKFIENNMGQYTVCCYGNQIDKLETLAKYLNIRILRS